MVVGKDGRQLRNDGFDIEMRTIYGDGLVDGLVADVELLDGSRQRRQHIGKSVVAGIKCSQCRKRSSQDTQISLESVMRNVEAFQFRENKSGGRKIARQLLVAQVECFYVSFFQGHALQLRSTLFALAHIPRFLPSHLDEGGIEHGEEFPLLSIHLVDGEGADSFLWLTIIICTILDFHKDIVGTFCLWNNLAAVGCTLLGIGEEDIAHSFALGGLCQMLLAIVGNIRIREFYMIEIFWKLCLIDGKLLGEGSRVIAYSAHGECGSTGIVIVGIFCPVIYAVS